MMRVLLRNQFKMSVNTIKTQPTKNYIGYGIAMIALVAIVYFLSKEIWYISDSIPVPILEGIISYGFITVIGFILLVGLPQVFKHLYAATDLQMLFTMPIPTRNIFWVKYMQSFIGIPFGLFFVFVIPLCVYGIAVNAAILFYPVLILVVLSFVIIGLSIAYLLNLLLIQLIPGNRANEFMTIMSAMSGLIVYLLFIFPTIVSDQSLTERLMAGLPLLPYWMPMSWGSTAIIESASGSSQFFLPFVLIILLAGISVLLATSLVEKGFRTGWIRLTEGSGKKSNKRKKHKKTNTSVHHPAIAIGIKEWFAIKRDMREWLVFMPIIFFIIFPLFGFLNSGAELSDLRGHNDISWPITQGALLFIYAIFNGSMAASSIAREGSSLWILRTLPLSGRDIAIGKLWISWLLPFILLTTIECIVGVLLGWTLFQFIIGIVVKAVITVGISAVGLWLGTIGAKYNPSNPQARLKIGTGFILMIASYIYLAITAIPYIFLIVPIDAVDTTTDMGDIGGFLGFLADVALTLLSWKASYPVLTGIIGVIVMLILSMGIATLFMRLSAKRIDKGIEIEMVREIKSKSLFSKKKTGSSLY
ncbi:putative ABC transporter permease subunit [Virgibacillus sp. DJP39]|uniref:putative ABC transporter permease subunit n=1 Tax=Virgibacillus sp. DJP39 TaxID=3409790 RepID=UPI003BB6D4C2